MSEFESRLTLSCLLLIEWAAGMTFIQSTVEVSTLKRQVFRPQITQGTHN